MSKFWLWVVITVLALAIVVGLIFVLKLAKWLIIIAALVAIIVWLVGVLYKITESMFNW